MIKIKERWLLRKNGNTEGPFTLEQLSNFAKQGKIKKSSMVYDNNASRWLRAEHVKGLFSQEEPDMYGRDEEALPDMTEKRNTIHELLVMGVALLLIVLVSYLIRGFF